MATRLQLHNELKELLGSSNVYYQPPPSVKIQYPCFIYNNNAGDSAYADNKSYRYEARYEVKYVTRDPETLAMTKKILRNFEMCSHDRSYVADNLYHESFDLFY